MACNTILHFGLQCIIIAPSFTHTRWLSISEQFGIYPLAIFSPQKLAGKQKSGLKHDLLVRREGKITFYQCTDTLRKLASEGIFIVVDECDFCKNKSSFNRSVAEVVRCCMKYGRGKSKVLLLGATPFDRLDHYPNFCRVLGMMGDSRDWRKDKQMHSGLRYAISLAEHLSGIAPEKPPEGCNMSEKNVIEYLRYLYVNFIRDSLVRYCIDYNSLAGKSGNYFYRLLSDVEYDIYEEGINILKSGIVTRHDGKTEITSVAKVTKGLQKISLSKSNLIAYLTDSQLQRDLDCKVIIFFYYRETASAIYDMLVRYYPGQIVEIHGEVPMEAREAALESFQRDDNDVRVALVSQSIAAGFDMDDKIGDRPRTMFLIPNYHFVKLVQSIGRGNRSDSQSIAEGKLIFTMPRYNENVEDIEEVVLNCPEYEILSSLQLKRDVLQEATGKKLQDNIFPGMSSCILEDFGN